MDARRAPERVLKAHFCDQRPQVLSIWGRPPLFRDFHRQCSYARGWLGQRSDLATNNLLADYLSASGADTAPVFAAINNRLASQGNVGRLVGVTGNLLLDAAARGGHSLYALTHEPMSKR
jgi:hypothetical protein